MKLAETVTFGGSGLNRAAELRDDVEAMQTYRANPASEAIVFWKGKPMIRRSAQDALVRVSMSHDLIADRADNALFLGLENGRAIFAHDVSDWVPEGAEEAATGAIFDFSEQSHPDFPETDVFSELRANLTCLNARDAELAATALAVFSWHRSHQFCSCVQ